MAISEVDIANSALGDLGAASISSLELQTGHARTIKAVFDTVRDFVLELHYWNFAKTRAPLSPVSADPLFGFSRAFVLPTDFLKLKETHPRLEQTEYRVESGKILCDESALSITYTRRVTDPNAMPPSFRECLAAYLASKIAKSVTGSDDAKTRMEALAEARLRTARRINAENAGQEEVDAPDLLIRVRGGEAGNG